MKNNPDCRAQQHLLVQGFTLYTCPAAVCVRLTAPPVLDSHNWAITLDKDSVSWIQQLPNTDPLKQHLLTAVSKVGKVNKLWALCCFKGSYLDMPLEVNSVRYAKDRLNKAINAGMTPPSIEEIVAIPDAILEAEVKRRKREKPAEEDEQQ